MKLRFSSPSETSAVGLCLVGDRVKLLQVCYLPFDAPTTSDEFAGPATGADLDDFIACFSAEAVHQRLHGCFLTRQIVAIKHVNALMLTGYIAQQLSQTRPR